MASAGWSVLPNSSCALAEAFRQGACTGGVPRSENWQIRRSSVCLGEVWKSKVGYNVMFYHSQRM